MTIDVNQVINPKLAVRVNGLLQTRRSPAATSSRSSRRRVALRAVQADRSGKLNFDYIHTDLNGLPDFGVPYNRFLGNRPFTEGFTNPQHLVRIRQSGLPAHQRTWRRWRQRSNSAKTSRSSRSCARAGALSHVGTLAESPAFFGQPWFGWTGQPQCAKPLPATWRARQPERPVIKYDVGPTKNTTIFGAEFSHEQIMRDTYSGLSSESTTGTPFLGSGSTTGSLLFPPNYLGFGRLPPRPATPPTSRSTPNPPTRFTPPPTTSSS